MRLQLCSLPNGVPCGPPVNESRGHQNQANKRAVSYSTNAVSVLACLNEGRLYPKVFLEERIAPEAEWHG
jgi:hypothetical protein